jgi:hypothetical protein
MNQLTIGRPEPIEHAPYYSKYINLVPGDVLTAMSTQIESTLATLGKVSDTDSLMRYEPGKWSLREVVGHLIDTERIFAYRALRIARGDKTPLASFEQDDYVTTAGFDRIPWHDLLGEFELVRRANVMMLRGLDSEAWMRTGVASENAVSVRALAYCMAGHELHHMKIVRERYLKS